MKRLSVHLLGAALGLLLFMSGASARADVLWSYDWTGPTSSTSVTSDTGNSMILFNNQTLAVAEGSSDILATNLTETFIHPVANDPYGAQNLNLGVKITDLASGESTTLNFAGHMSGNIKPLSSHINCVFQPPTTQDAWLGGNHYVVTIGPYTPPGPPGSFPGSIGAHVEVIGRPNDAPEPSTMLLSLLGFSFTGVVGWRKMRAA